MARFQVLSGAGEGTGLIVDHVVVDLTEPADIRLARKYLRSGRPMPYWLVGLVKDGSGGYNVDSARGRPWSWHFENAGFAEVTPEGYNAWPSEIEENLPYWRDQLGSADVVPKRIEAELPIPAP